jgi:hypothetical protein
MTVGFLVLVAVASITPASVAVAADDARLIVHRGDDVNAMLARLVGEDGVTRVLEHNGLSAGAAPAPGQELVVPGGWLVDVTRGTAEVLYVRGQVTARAAGGATLPAGVGARLEVGDVLVTGADGSASLRLIGAEQSLDHDHLFVDPDSELEIAQLLVTEDRGWRSALVRLFKGAVEVVTSGSAESRKQVEVETPTAIGGVRGTEFRIAVEPAAGDAPVATRIESLDGNVMTAAAGAEVTVGGGFGSRAREGSPPDPPRPLPPAPALVAPAEGAAIETFAFRWEPVDGAASYVLEIAEDGGFLRVDQRIETVDPEFAPDRAALPQQSDPLHWRVSAVDDEGFRGLTSPPRSFTIAP